MRLEVVLPRFRGHPIICEEASTISFARAPYRRELRRRPVALVRPGRAPEAPAREPEPSAQSIRNRAAATQLARLWRSQGETDQARDLLAPICGWFTEGFDTADLGDAKALLDEVN